MSSERSGLGLSTRVGAQGVAGAGVLGGLLLGPHPQPHPGQVVCSVGREDRPLRHQSSLPQTLEVALARCGLGEPGQVAVVRQRVKAAAEAALAAVLALEAGLSAEQRGGRRARDRKSVV